MIALMGAVSPVAQSDQEHASGQGAAKLLLGAPDPAAEAIGSAQDARLHGATHLLAHGEKHGFGSVIAAPHEVVGALTDLLCIL